MRTRRPLGAADGAPDRVAEALRRIPEVVAAALVGADLRVVVDADPVAAGRAVIPTIGDLLVRYADVVADFAVLLLGEGLSQRLGIPFVADCVTKVREVRELKNVFDYDERLRLLAGTFVVDRAKVEGRRVLLFDDLYRSGATMNEITALLYDQG